MEHESYEPGWYVDNADQRYIRFWDGDQWTDRVLPRQETTDASDWEALEGDTGQAQVAKQLQRAGIEQPLRDGGGTLFTEPVLVVNQQAKYFELANSYVVYDQHARLIGVVEQVGQSRVQKMVRFFTTLDSILKVRLEIRDAHGVPVLRLTRPATVWKSKVRIERPDGTSVGEIVQEAIGKVRFAYLADGVRIGGIHAENWRAWDFSIRDHNDAEVARITKTWQGFAKAAFTTADNYVIQFHRELPDPLLSMVVASGVTLDTALSQSQIFTSTGGES